MKIFRKLVTLSLVWKLDFQSYNRRPKAHQNLARFLRATHKLAAVKVPVIHAARQAISLPIKPVLLKTPDVILATRKDIGRIVAPGIQPGELYVLTGRINRAN